MPGKQGSKNQLRVPLVINEYRPQPVSTDDRDDVPNIELSNPISEPTSGGKPNDNTSFQPSDLHLTRIALALAQRTAPIFINSCVLYLGNFGCTSIVSGLGVNELAAANYANLIRLFCVVIPGAFFNPTLSNFLSQKPENTGSFKGLTVATTTLLSLPITAISMISFWYSSHLLSLVGEEEDTIALVKEYTKNFMWGIPAYMWLNMLSSVFWTTSNKENGRSYWAMLLAVLRTSLDLLLTGLLVRVQHKGFAGWPIATAIQQWATFLFVMATLLASPQGAELQKELTFPDVFLSNLKKHLVEQVSFGSPPVVQSLALASNILALSLFAGSLSEQSFVGYNVAGAIAYWLKTIAIPFESGINILINAMKDKLIKQDLATFKHYLFNTFVTSFFMILLLSTSFMIPMLFAPSVLTKIFISNSSENKEANHLLATLMPLNATFALIFSIKSTLTGLLRGSMQKTLLPFLLDFIISIPVCLIAYFVFTANKEYKSVIGISSTEITGAAISTLILTGYTSYKIKNYQGPSNQAQSENRAITCCGLFGSRNTANHSAIPNTEIIEMTTATNPLDTSILTNDDEEKQHNASSLEYKV